MEHRAEAEERERLTFVDLFHKRSRKVAAYIVVKITVPPAWIIMLHYFDHITGAQLQLCWLDRIECEQCAADDRIFLLRVTHA